MCLSDVQLGMTKDLFAEASIPFCKFVAAGYSNTINKNNSCSNNGNATI